MKDKIFTAPETIALCLLCALIGCIGGCGTESKDQQRAAIKAGVARYTVDPATGITKFEYVKP